jgi:hypothetical protein
MIIGNIPDVKQKVESTMVTERGNPPAPGIHSMGTSWPTGTDWGTAVADAWRTVSSINW